MKITFDIDELLQLDRPAAGDDKMDREAFINWLRNGLGGEVFNGLADVIEAELPNYNDMTMEISAWIGQHTQKEIHTMVDIMLGDINQRANDNDQGAKETIEWLHFKITGGNNDDGTN